MKKLATLAGLVVVLLLALASSVAVANHNDDDGDDDFRARLVGFEEVPAVSTAARGRFTAELNDDTLTFELQYSGLEATATAAHIHFGQRSVDGGVIAFLCGGGGKPACPSSGTVTGTIVPADILGPAIQGIAAGEFSEAIRALRKGVVYANVHSVNFPDGEIRGQVKED